MVEVCWPHEQVRVGGRDVGSAHYQSHPDGFTRDGLFGRVERPEAEPYATAALIRGSLWLLIPMASFVYLAINGHQIAAGGVFSAGGVLGLMF
jgi:hypothetical protein